ncbi:hypothetical protein NB636_05970 [Oxalobacter aliiformigenes]|uniref:hypothetical protein n=1 Tax=Oxalobacter aliiformigenes TaxID=2946593 RepID=UPI0022AF52D9|nr:hypothetical protein [Oxalobacter aliiformigenes]MCZ4065156.1 hypothetical protein [Oxalobacter aliiformigenes]WAV98295.1 hypothetical protein NB636_05970 [Oxalobacter aliiformigenes]
MANRPSCGFYPCLTGYIHSSPVHSRTENNRGTFGTGTPQACRYTAGKNGMRHFEKSELILL